MLCLMFMTFNIYFLNVVLHFSLSFLFVGLFVCLFVFFCSCGCVWIMRCESLVKGIVWGDAITLTRSDAGILSGACRRSNVSVIPNNAV